MSPVSLSEIPLTYTERFRQYIRIPIVALSLGFLAYHVFYLAAFVPFFESEFFWDEGGQLIVWDVPDDLSPGLGLQKGDRIETIDGAPARMTLWQPLYRSGQDVYEHTVQRGDDILTVYLPAVERDANLLRQHLMASAVALLIWFIGAVAILFATPKNHDAWQLGFTTLGSAVVLSASEAALYGVPLTWITSYPFLPLVAVALAQMTQLSRTPSQTERALFRVLYGIAAIIGLLSLLDIVYLGPQGYSLRSLTGISSYEILYSCLGLGGVAYLATLAWYSIWLPASYQKRQTLIIFAFTIVALAPAIFLTVLPRILFGKPLLPWDFSIMLLALIPAGYGFIIYRKNYLQLDIFVTNSLTLLLIMILLLSSYSLIYYLVQGQELLMTLEPLSGSLLLLPALLVMPSISQKTYRVLESVIYGDMAWLHGNKLQIIASALTADPQISTLKATLHDIADMLEIRQSLLLLVSNEGVFTCADRLRVTEEVMPFSYKEQQSLPAKMAIRSHGAESVYAQFFWHYSWCDYVIPLAISDTVVGVLLLGGPVPNGYLNARQVSFLLQVASVIAVAMEATRLFTSMREMSRDLMRVCQEERQQIASQIHDDPMQTISRVADDLNRLFDQRDTIDREMLFMQLAESERLLQAVNVQMREICMGLYPIELKQGAQLAVRHAVRTLRETTGMDIALTMDISLEVVIPRQITMAIYAVAKEALRNVHKHANATAAWVHFGYQEDYLVLSVMDNGHYQPIASSALVALFRARHFGIAGMYEWADLVGGHLTIVPREGGGTAVTLRVPFVR